MKTFLHEVAQQLIAENPSGLEQVLVVFNNRRPSLFLKREIIALEQGRGTSSFFLPRMMGMDDLVNLLSPLKITANEFLLFELYDIQQQLLADQPENPHHNETFEDFLSFGEMMLGDFSELDHYQVDARKLFLNLKDTKDIEQWGLGREPLTAMQKNYLQFYQNLLTYYTRLQERLTKQGRAYGGMAYRQVAQQAEQLTTRLPYRRVYFVGFSIVSPCERDIILACVKHRDGRIIADGDDYYVANPWQEAGQHLRQLHEMVKPRNRTGVITPSTTNDYPLHLTQRHHKITLVKCPESLMQTKYAGTKLRQLVRKRHLRKHGNSAQDTAVVLANEQLLLPVLNSLPRQVLKANVTMGLPFNLSSAYGLLLHILQLYKGLHGNKCYHRDLVSLLSNPLLQLLTNKQGMQSAAQDYLAKNQLVYLSEAQIGEMFKTLRVNYDTVAFIFEPMGKKTISEEKPRNAPFSPSNFLSVAKRIIIALTQGEQAPQQEKGKAKGNDTHTSARLPLVYSNEERQSLAAAYEIVEYLEQLQQRYTRLHSLPTLEKLYNRLARRHNVAFYGEPLQGLQILGVLETRCLDFRNIIVLGANEGIIPSGRTPNTLIPMSLKHAFGIPTYADNDAVYAYHFYRMLQRCGNATLVYHTQTTGSGKGEPSRFLLQIQAEMASSCHRLQLSRQSLKVSSRRQEACPQTCAEKTPAVMQLLQEKAQAGFSPSALNTYRNCPLQFYRNYVLHVGEENDVEESIDSSELGSMVHEVLCDIYKQDNDGHIRQSTLQEARDNVEQRVDDIFASKFKKGRSEEGLNHYYRAVAKKQVSQLLAREIAFLKKGGSIFLLQAEEELSATLKLHNGQQVNIKGRVDRIDQIDDGKGNSTTRVIDYKTGSVATKDLAFANTNKKGEVIAKRPSDKWWQVMTYAWLYTRKHPLPTALVSGIYSLGNLREEFLKATWNEQEEITPTHLQTFEEQLTTLLDEIMDADTPFTRTDTTQHCNYCPYAPICNRPSVKK